jgi:hypothetical protein
LGPLALQSDQWPRHNGEFGGAPPKAAERWPAPQLEPAHRRNLEPAHRRNLESAHRRNLEPAHRRNLEPAHRRNLESVGPMK